MCDEFKKEIDAFNSINLLLRENGKKFSAVAKGFPHSWFFYIGYHSRDPELSEKEQEIERLKKANEKLVKQLKKVYKLNCNRSAKTKKGE